VVCVRLAAVYVDAVAPLISVKLILSVDDCHWIVPVFPLNVNVVLLLVAHTVVPPLTVPPTEAGFTVIIAASLNVVHAPFTITARKYVVAVKAPEVYVLFVFAISVALAKLLVVDDCHLLTVPPL
jgi:hypothetical protein